MDTQTRSTTFVRLAIGFVYLFFGLLKLFPDLSPGELLAGQTITRLTMGAIEARDAIWWLGMAESAIGLSFLFNFQTHWTFFVFLGHQVGTFTPLVLLPELTFKVAPFAPTMEGQYILKNVVFVSAAVAVLWPAVAYRWKRDLAKVSSALSALSTRPTLPRRPSPALAPVAREMVLTSSRS